MKRFKRYYLHFLLVCCFLALPSISNADIISGDLTYSNQDQLISSSSGQTYLAFMPLGITYNEAAAATANGGIYSEYHMANQSEAYEFFNFANIGTDVLDNPNQNDTYRVWTDNNEIYRFGSYASINFINDDDDDSTFGRISGDLSHISSIYITEQAFTIDAFSRDTYEGYGFLMVADNPMRPVPEPTTMLLFGTGLISLAGISRRRKNN